MPNSKSATEKYWGNIGVSLWVFVGFCLDFYLIHVADSLIMARPKRIDIPFSLYHVFSRTVSREKAFIDHRDERKFLSYLEKYLDLYSFRLHGWCFMPNHFHLLLERGKTDGLSNFMHRLLTAYTVYFNRRHSRHGHLFQGRFKSHIVDKSSYLLAVSRYIHLNPLESNLADDPEKYKGSSLRFYINGGEPEYLYTEEILKWFDGDRQKYGEFIREGMDEDIKPAILRQKYIGGEAFAKRTKQRLLIIQKREKRLDNRDPCAITKDEEKFQHEANEILRRVSEYFGISEKKIKGGRHAKDETSLARKILIFLLRDDLPWTIQQIGKFVGVRDPSIIHSHIRAIREKKHTMKCVHDLQKKLQNPQKPRG